MCNNPTLELAVTDEMVEAYLNAVSDYWFSYGSKGNQIEKSTTGSAKEATRIGLVEALKLFVGDHYSQAD